MNKRIIKQVLKKKFDSWVESINDEEVKKIIRENTIITGGCIASMLLKEKINDYDIYFRNKETVKKVAQYYIDKFKKLNPEHHIYLLDGEEVTEEQKQSLISYKYRNMDEKRIKIIIDTYIAESEEDEESLYETEEEMLEDADYIPAVKLEKEKKSKDDKYVPVYISANAITLSDKIQIIIRFYGEPDEVHSTYDFSHCMNYWTSENNELILKQEALESLLTKQLIYKGSKYPLCSVIRTRKFIKKGWNLNAGQYLKMLKQTSELDLNDICVLEDQLVSIDSFFFAHMINALTKKMKDDENFQLTNEYLFSIIDRIFG